MTTFNAAQWREQIIEAVDDCNHRCLPWEEQHRRVEKLVEKLRAAALDEALEACHKIELDYEEASKDASGVPCGCPFETGGREAAKECQLFIRRMMGPPPPPPTVAFVVDLTEEQKP